MDSPLATIPNFVFLCLLVIGSCIQNFLLVWCCHSHPLKYACVLPQEYASVDQVEPRHLTL